MANKIAVVTGASRGLGQEIAFQFVRDCNYDVVLIARKGCEDTEKRIAELGKDCRVLTINCDCADPKQVAEMGKKVADFGGCDILVNNIGIYPYIMFEDLDYKTWKDYFAVNVDSPYNCLYSLLPQMKEKGWGRVVNIVSDAFMNAQEPMLAGYIATKGAVIGLTRALASEYGPMGVTLNCVAPGLFVTEETIKKIGGAPGEIPEGGFNKWDLMKGLQSIKKYPYPTDFTGAIKFLVSEEAGFMTGQTMVVDGGIARV
ncbi:MAG: SDR family oxidoreductase [Eubacterium sp.]|nr:SDR family oxidoreductase [Eubacterium sp.]